MIRWCQSGAQLGDVVTKDSDVARAPWELFVRRGFDGSRCTIPSSNPHATVQNVDLTFLAEPDNDEFAKHVPRDSKSVTLTK